MEKNNPKYSIIIRCYNDEKFIQKCLESAVNQTFCNHEIIISDDGSTDKSLEICNKFQKKYSNIKIISCNHQGRVKARNTGLFNSSGQYLIYLDGDDWLKNNCLEATESILSDFKNKPEMIVYKWREITKQNLNEKYQTSKNSKGGLFSHQYIKENVEKFIPTKDLTVTIYKKNLLLKHYCKDADITIGEDNAFTYECLYNAKYVYFCNCIMYNYNRTLYYGRNCKKNSGLYEPSYLGNYVFNNLGKQYKDKKLHQQLTKWFYDYYWIRLPEHLNQHKSIIKSAQTIKNDKNLKLNLLAKHFIPYPGIKFRDKLTWFISRHNMWYTYFIMLIILNHIRK